MTEKQDEMPKIGIKGQYVKDISFENPKAPHIFSEQKEAPQIDLSLNIHATHLGAEDYEVMLSITVKAKSQTEDLFVAELKYAGVFMLHNVPEQEREPILLIYCPTMLFPFARRIVADLTRDGGFQPLMIDPIDFAALYAQKHAANVNATEAN